MFDILGRSLKTGIVTASYPCTTPAVSARARGRPRIDYVRWKDARIAARACPTGAISFADQGAHRTTALDLSKCIICGLCAEADTAIRMTPEFELACSSRQGLIETARYRLKQDASHAGLEEMKQPQTVAAADVGQTGRALQKTTRQVFGRSLHIRQVDAGSCNGCEIEIHGLNSPFYDVERFGIHFVASPRHADMLLVTGPVTRNMELALKKTYEAMPPPRLVVAVGACGCSGGIFGVNYATRGAVDTVIPVDVYVPGCPPNPCALLHGILLAVGRLPTAKVGNAS
jgi:Ni,Fe-hydrogenase III small subunit/formate hydrogenlyase subunit 6/NADH:ubiquinone oxidoreductase subunit I